MNAESAVISILMYSLSVYSALTLNDVFSSVLLWLLGVTISIIGFIRRDK